MFSPTRNQARSFLFDTWRKYRSAESLSDLEKIALQIISLHPEYHRLLDDPARYLEHDYAPEDGSINPFLHLSLHLAVEEQLAIDQPSGIRAHFERIVLATGLEHDAKHSLIECLAETIWQAQRTGAMPDQAAYLACLREKFKK